MGLFSGPGLTPTLKGVPTNVVTLKAGQVQTIYPAGWWAIKTGGFTTVQQYDPITLQWRIIGGGGTGAGVEYFYSDGVNYRLANQQGCAVGVVITNVGSGYTSAPTVTVGTTGGVYRAIIGGAISQTVVVTAAGTGYTYPPFVEFSAPPPGGVQATGYATLTTGTVTSVTVVDQGAGYTAGAPSISFVNDPREGLNGTTVGYGAAAYATITGANEIAAIVQVDHGNPVAYTAGTATAIPSVTISGGGGSSGAGTAIMCWSIVGLNSTYTAGVLESGTPIAYVTGIDQPTAPNATILNPFIQSGLVKTRLARLYVPIVTGTMGAYTTAVVQDGGIYTGTPLDVVSANPSTTVTTQPIITFVMGYNASDTTYLTQV